MKVKIVKVSPVSFIGQDGKEVNGQYFFYQSVLGGNITRIFMTNDAVLRLSAMPESGYVYYLIHNAAGKVVDMIETDGI